MTQVNNIYVVVGFGSLVRTNGYATVESSSGPLFTFAAEADNKSGDLILVVGAKDVAAPPGFNPPTATAVAETPTPTPTPTVPGPTATNTPTRTPTTPATITVSLVATQFQWTFSGADGASGSTFNAKVEKFWVNPRQRLSGTAARLQRVPSLGLSAQSP